MKKRILAYVVIILSVVYFYKAEAVELNWKCTTLMIKEPESEGYMAINKSLEIADNPDKPVVRQWTQVFTCL